MKQLLWASSGLTSASTPDAAPRAPPLTSPTRGRLIPRQLGLAAAHPALTAHLAADASPRGAAGLRKGSALLESFTGRFEGTHPKGTSLKSAALRVQGTVPPAQRYWGHSKGTAGDTAPDSAHAPVPRGRASRSSGCQPPPSQPSPQSQEATGGSQRLCRVSQSHPEHTLCSAREQSRSSLHQQCWGTLPGHPVPARKSSE